MIGRSQSEDRQDFQHQVTPIRYDDICKTQGESQQRHQVYTSRNQHQAPSSYRSYDTKPRSSMTALDFRDTVHASFADNSSQPYDLYDDDFVPPTDLTDTYETLSARGKHSEDDTDTDNTVIVSNSNTAASCCALSASQSYRTAISATFRGYCSELFVYGKCSKRDTGCVMDHSSAAQERCINSFVLLSKRELGMHADFSSMAVAIGCFFQVQPFSPVLRCAFSSSSISIYPASYIQQLCWQCQPYCSFSSVSQTGFCGTLYSLYG